LEKENGELRRQRDTVTDETNALQLQVERRDTEIERMRTELSSLSSQLQTAIAAKCQTLAETEEVRSREMTLDFKYILKKIIQFVNIYVLNVFKCI